MAQSRHGAPLFGLRATPRQGRRDRRGRASAAAASPSPCAGRRHRASWGASGGSARRAWLLALLFALLFLAFWPLPGSAQDLPALTGRVVDLAELIGPAAETALTARLAAFEKKSSDQIVVATVPGLGGEAIEPYANRLFRAWKLGRGAENNGVLLLVARDDRRMRIEVGYGLEGTLTDLDSKLIIENTLVPAFRAGDFAGGITAAADRIIAVLEGDPAGLEARRDEAGEAGGGEAQGGELPVPPEVLIFILVWGGIFIFAFGGSVLPPIFGRRTGPNTYRWLGMTFNYNKRRTSSRSSTGWTAGSDSGGSGWSSGSGGGGGWSSGSSSGGGFSGGGGSSGGGGASGSW